MREGSGKSIVTGVVIALCSGSFGFGISQVTLATEVRVHTQQLNYLSSEFNSEKLRAEKRMEAVAGLVEAMLKQNQDFIGLLKVQNELLARKI